MATFTFQQGDLPKLDLQVDRGTDFAAWKAQWDCYSSLSGLTDQSDEKQVQALTLCFSRETLTIVQNLGLSEDDRKKALSHALMSYPELNAIASDNADYITYKASHNIGVAVDTQGGLIVPNIKHVQAKNILEVSKELKRLTDLAHQGKLGPDDINGGTFTISNIGNIGGTYTKPLLLPPEVAIGGFGRILSVPKYSETGEIVKGYVMNVSWSADHRVIDGALLARFSNLWRSYLESPELLILDLK